MKRTTWTLIVAALLFAGFGVHLIVTQPLNRQIASLTEQVDQLHSGMRQLADYRDEVAGTNDLLSSLQTQSQHTRRARAALDDMRRLEREVMLQSASADDALAALTDMAALHGEVVAQSSRAAEIQQSLGKIAHCQKQASHLAEATDGLLVDIDLAEQSLQQLGDFQQRVALEASDLETAQDRFAQLISLKQNIEQVPPATIDAARQQLDAFDGLAQRLIDQEEQTARAGQASADLLALQDEIVARGARVEVARQHAEHLLQLEERLANDAGRDIEAATQNLAALLRLEEQLAAQDQQLAAAIESLELLQDLQSEFVERTRDLESIRRGLTELILMESMVARTVHALRPLSELADLRRLDAGQLHTIARSMLSQQERRIATHDETVPAASAPSIRNEQELTPTEEALVPIPPVE